MSPQKHMEENVYEQALRYIENHPEAADTVEGIAEWWLHNLFSVTKVKEAVERLVAEGLMIEIEGAHSQSIYRSNLDKR